MTSPDCLDQTYADTPEHDLSIGGIEVTPLDDGIPLDPGVVEALRACMRLLSRRGKSGEIVWRHGKTIKDPIDRLMYLRHALKHFSQYRGKENRYIQLPVDIRTFLESSELMKLDDIVYPKIMRELEEMCSGRYVEAVLTGGIGAGKSSAAIFAIIYNVYILACLVNPHKEFDIDPSSEIMFIFQSLSLGLAKTVDYMRFKTTIDSAPFFQKQFRYDRNLSSELHFPNRIIVKPLTGSPNAAVGQNILGGIIDEINDFPVVEDSKLASDGGIYDGAIQLYNAIVRRRKSRFMKKGTLPGLLCLVSSKKRPGEFTDRKIKEAKTDKTIFVYDKRVWEVKPEGTFSGEWFEIFVGDATRKPRILQEGDSVSPADQALVMKIPVEYRSEFERDILSALRDVAGVATQALHPFMPDNEKVAKAFGKTISILSRPDCDFDCTFPDVVPWRFISPKEPRFVHLDLSISSDSTGVACGYVCGFEKVIRADGMSEMMPTIHIDFLLEVKPPRNGEVDYAAIRGLLYKIRNAGINIKWVSADSFQSRDSLQILRQQGFITGIKSVDTDLTPYTVLKTGLMDGRVRLPEHQKCQLELARLEFDSVKGKVDHPSSADGSKDVADALAGVVYGLTYRRETWSRHKVPLTMIPRSLFRQTESKEEAIRVSQGRVTL